MDAAEAIGKRVLIGITFLDSDGSTVLDQQQCSGIITKVGDDAVYIRDDETGEEITFPPDLSGYDPAPPGEYRLRSNGRVVTDPDLIGVWEIIRPQRRFWRRRRV